MKLACPRAAPGGSCDSEQPDGPRRSLAARGRRPTKSPSRRARWRCFPETTTTTTAKQQANIDAERGQPIADAVDVTAPTEFANLYLPRSATAARHKGAARFDLPPPPRPAAAPPWRRRRRRTPWGREMVVIIIIIIIIIMPWSAVPQQAAAAVSTMHAAAEEALARCGRPHLELACSSSWANCAGARSR